ncbi:MAG: polyphenol oxidase family protein [Deltaproteobacteria bacterium]|nr:polyphenol oxidase family protein [Deltaproteobacteria bacterium]
MRTRELLSQFTWEAPAKTSLLLTRAGFDHGFYGTSDTAPECHHVRQVHGTKIVPTAPDSTSAKAPHRIEADALYTFERDSFIAVKTADCIPVLLAIPGQMVAGIHAGWRGLTRGIIMNAVDKLVESGQDVSRMIAVVGPTISRERFEVGAEVVDALLTPASGLSMEQAAFTLSKGSTDRWHLDLQVAAALALSNAGIPAGNIGVIQACTYARTDWHSFRRDAKGAGVNWSWIKLG